MGLIGLILAVCALLCSVYLWLELRRKVSREDIAPALLQASEEQSKKYEKQFREVETEWTEMYQKFMRLAGRVDKIRGLEAAQSPQNQGPGLVLTGSRSDLLRKHRGGAQRE